MSTIAHDPAYEVLFSKLVAAHVDAASRRRRAPAAWCAFWPMVGWMYRPGGVMVVGRALNGWGASDFTVAAMGAPGGITDLSGRCRESFCSASECPMSWVKDSWGAEVDYRTSRSQFWQTARRLATHAGAAEPDWPSTLVWTNLMRVSPAGGRNPPDWSYFAQLQPAAELLDYELQVLQPARAVLLTGRDWWAPFQDTGIFRLTPVDADHVHSAGLHRQTRIIVSDHPQTRSPDRIMAELAKYWQ